LIDHSFFRTNTFVTVVIHSNDFGFSYTVVPKFQLPIRQTVGIGIDFAVGAYTLLHTT